jgi:hypothetical protein
MVGRACITGAGAWQMLGMAQWPAAECQLSPVWPSCQGKPNGWHTVFSRLQGDPSWVMGSPWSARERPCVTFGWACSICLAQRPGCGSCQANECHVYVCNIVVKK